MHIVIGGVTSLARSLFGCHISLCTQRARSMSALHAAASAAEMLPRVLSIQSHTVYGYVGNKAATFPLQLLGFEVDPLNTVLLSNHGGYPIVKGRGMGGPQLEELLEGLKLNKLLETYSYISSGYCRDASFLDVLADAVQTMKSKNPVKYHLDPVLGDDGKLYIPEECLTIYRERLLPLADVVTPNAFEAKLLTGIEIKTEQDAVKACKALHARGPRTVLITSVIAAEGKLKVIGSQMLNGTTGPGAEVEVYELELPMIEGSFTGCGDLFSAMLLANMHMHPDDFPTALELACSVVHRVVEITAKLAKAPAGAKPPTAPCPELQLVRCKDAIEDKVAHFRARAIRDKDEVLGVIFDMDGTLTEPGNIDFSAMRRRLGIPPSGDILADIQKMPESKQAEALQIVEEEELAALEKLVLQPGLTEVMLSLSRRRIKCAIATSKRKHPFPLPCTALTASLPSVSLLTYHHMVHDMLWQEIWAPLSTSSWTEQDCLTRSLHLLSRGTAFRTTNRMQGWRTQ
ncbi:unnamed protein product [Chrysoparadoxa australica]